jgi:L,D-peptidoglycan transpeptidase YkuD (ErfK/YbiS/YcfS/YnhG family)
MSRCPKPSQLLVRARWLLAGAVWWASSSCGSGALERSARAESSHARSVTVEVQGATRALPPTAACEQLGQPIAPSVTQLVVVTSADFTAWRAELQRYERSSGGAWRASGPRLPVVLGRSGYAWGDGLHGSGAPVSRTGPRKREGDGRSPAGVFAIGTMHGYAATAPAGATLPYQQATAAQRCVDDPRAAEYNRIVEAGPHGESWRSAERMRRDDAVYELALDIEHNRSPVIAGHGSCIFAHVWVNAQTPVAGCTGMELAELRALLVWLQPGALWVSLPGEEYRALRTCGDLP